jgi:hypothetical protein
VIFEVLRSAKRTARQNATSATAAATIEQSAKNNITHQVSPNRLVLICMEIIQVLLKI